MTKGVLLFAHDNGDVNYTAIAAWSASRIHQHLDVPVSLVTDQQLKFDHPFDQVIIAEAESNSHRKQAPWKNMGRYRAGELTPYDHTILLDVDYVVCSDQLRCLFNTDQCLVSMRWARDITGRIDDENLNYFGRHRMPSAWATVVSWKRSKIADHVFGMMQMIQQNWQHYLNLYGVSDPKFRNDFALAIASNTVWGHIGEWPSIPWTMSNVHEGVDLSQIDADEFTLRYIDQQTRPKTFNIKNMDFHAMCKQSLGEIVGSTM
jgi:hypothetical protein